MRSNERTPAVAERLVSRRRVLRSSFFASAAVLGCAGRWPNTSARGRWRRRASVPWRVQEVYGTVLAGCGLIAGGMIRDADRKLVALDRVGIYDPDADRWTEGPHLPATRHHPALVTVHERVYAIGGATHVSGREGQWRQCTDVFVLDDKIWWRGPVLPQPQSEAVALVHDGRVHVIGGRTPKTPGASRWRDQRDVATHRVLDVGAGSWSDARPLPSPRSSAAGAVIDGRLYVVGGRMMRRGDVAELVRYDPAADRWDRLRPLPRAAAGLAAAALDGMLYAFGGQQRERARVLGAAWRYDPATDRWDALPDLLTPCHGLAALVLDGTIFAIGGGRATTFTAATDLVEAYTPT